jgi:hypothetical protein
MHRNPSESMKWPLVLTVSLGWVSTSKMECWREGILFLTWWKNRGGCPLTRSLSKVVLIHSWGWILNISHQTPSPNTVALGIKFPHEFWREQKHSNHCTDLGNLKCKKLIQLNRVQKIILRKSLKLKQVKKWREMK